MKFRYTALNAGSQKEEGVLEAASKNAAQETLHKMGLSIIVLEETEGQEAAAKPTAEKTAPAEISKVPVFIFEATDPNGKAVSGTIEAESDHAAYRRLITEYHFKVQKIYPENGDENAKKTGDSKIRQWQNELEEEDFGENVKEKTEKDEINESAKIDKALVTEIDKIIQTGKAITEKHADIFSREHLGKIREITGELERIRTSNNVKHIAEVSNQLFDLIDSPDALQGEKETHAAYQKTMQPIKDSSFLKEDLKNYKKALGLQKLKGIFSGLSRRIKKLGQKKPALKNPENPLPETGIAPAEAAKEMPQTGFKKVLFYAKEWMAAKNPIIKKSRRHELEQAWHEWHPFKKHPKEPAPAQKTRAEKPAASVTSPAQKTTETTTATPPKEKKDFSLFFMEADSFTSWLLFFYIAYFFIAGFSIEKGIGLPEGFVIKTLVSPLIFNIAIFLLFTHALLRVKIRRFQKNAMGSAFLFLFGYGLFTFLIFNF